MRAAIRGTGSYLPERVVSNHDLERATGDFDRERSGCSLDEWVHERIGVRSRRRVAPGEGSAQMMIEASRLALDDAGMDGADLDLIVMSTFTSDHRLPQSVSIVQDALGSPAKCIQIEAACAGFVDGLAVANGLMQTMGYRNVLVGHSEVVSAVVDDRRFLMQAIFADGAGAVVLQPSEEEGILAHEMFTDGSKCGWLTAGGGTLSPPTPESVEDGSYYLDIDTKAIFPFAVARMSESLLSVVERAGRTVADVDWVIAHQTGVNITQGVAENVGLDVNRFLMTLEHTGNTSGATIPVALDHFNRQGYLAEGDFVVMPTVGAGMAWGAVCLDWAETPAGRRARAAQVDDAVIDLTRTGDAAPEAVLVP
ncbi:MAG TPA: beta-ketoacyl-ACP synthase 3 [Acidimicrobiales bacterium]|nr:beta-ketoacyl-ACP synthase 3 [Acidimicrobiales bacterium]